jgi:type IV secretion system protein TrbL
MTGVASGVGNVASTGAQAAVSPLKRAASKAADSLRSSYQSGANAAAEIAGGTSEAEAPGGAAPPATAEGQPDWAKRMKRNQQLSQGVQVAAHAVKSGDSHGGGTSINLSESD